MNRQSFAQPVLQLRQTRACCVLRQIEEPESSLDSQKKQCLNCVQYDLLVIYRALLQIMSDRQLRFFISETWMGFWLKMFLKVSGKQCQERFSFIVTCSNLARRRNWTVSVVTGKDGSKDDYGAYMQKKKKTRQQLMYKFYWKLLWLLAVNIWEMST